jgi:hypothetical protein
MAANSARRLATKFSSTLARMVLRMFLKKYRPEPSLAFLKSAMAAACSEGWPP